MDLYNQTARQISRVLTNRYSSSFSTSSRLFASDIRPHIYAIYGLVRIADEIVDTYEGEDKKILLDALENETYTSIERAYSTNPIVHAFSLTASDYGIDRELIAPFFESMRTDISHPDTFTHSQYDRYIYGSAEVVGLMCLKVFVHGDENKYNDLKEGASKLGAAYQKVNFLRDFADDYVRLHRIYFPGLTYETFDDDAKKQIEDDITQDFILAKKAINKLPSSSQKAVAASFTLYSELFQKLQKTSAATIKQKRIRLSNTRKAWYIVTGLIKGRV